MVDMFYLELCPRDLLPIENNPNIELVKDTRITPDGRSVKIWMWVAYGMIAVKNVYKHPSYRPRVGCNCMDDIQRILTMAFDKVKEQWYYLLGETYGTDVVDKVKGIPYWNGIFAYTMLYDANGVRELRLLNILIDGPSWDVKVESVRNLWRRSLIEKELAKEEGEVMWNCFILFFQIIIYEVLKASIYKVPCYVLGLVEWKKKTLKKVLKACYTNNVFHV